MYRKRKRSSESDESYEPSFSGSRKVEKNLAKKKKESEALTRCNVCNQRLCNAQIYNPQKTYLDEILAITSNEVNIEGQDDLQYIMNDFTIYCENQHICRFEGLIEKDALLYAAGDLYKLVDADLSKEGVQAKVGPILSWQLQDIDESMRVHILISTESAFYVLKQPSTNYLGHYRDVEEMFILSNQVMEFIEEETADASYGDLISYIQSLDVSTSLTLSCLNEDHLHSHAQFIVDQLQIYDSTYLEHPSIEHLMELTGASSQIKQRTLTNVVKRRRTRAIRSKKQKAIPVVTSKIVGEMMKDLHGNSNGSKESLNKSIDRMEPIDKEEHNFLGQMLKSKRERLRRNDKPLKVERNSYILHDASKIYYEDVRNGQQNFKVFDCISIPKTNVDKQRFGYIVNIFTYDDDDNNDDDDKLPYAHIILMISSRSTFLSDFGDPNEFFLTKQCCDVLLTEGISKLSIEYLNLPTDFNENEDTPYRRSRHSKFFYKLWYTEKTARFEDLPQIISDPPVEEYVECYLCEEKAIKKKKESLTFGKSLIKKGEYYTYKSFRYKGETFSVEDAIFLKPGSFSFNLKKSKIRKKPNIPKEDVDEELYPEYRRKNFFVRSSACDVGKPFQIGLIKLIFGNEEREELSLLIQKFYRPEDTILQPDDYVTKGLNEVFYSEEIKQVEISNIIKKCSLHYSEKHEEYKELDQMLQPRFYYKQMFDAKSKMFTDAPESCSSTVERKTPSFKKLVTMEVFAGCGGLSEGLKQAGVADVKYAIEIDSSAAESYKRNNPQTKVYTEDSSIVFRDLLSGSEEVKKQYPRKGEIELLCGGPPCQGFSGINRFSTEHSSKLKNDLISGFLSYCDYYRPRFIIMENVRRLVTHSKGDFLRVIMAILLRLNYQCTFAILQAGHYGAPQTRTRAIILAATPGEKLPLYPEPLYTFYRKFLKVNLGEKVYVNNIVNAESAPMRHITIRDAISDLPKVTLSSTEIENESKQTADYTMEPKTSFQQNIRRGSNVLSDHYCQILTPLTQARIEHIPKTPGCDWRDLPNKRVRLSDGSYSDILQYKYDYVYKGRKQRGVCNCVITGECDKEDKQSKTLIPWCLPHTADTSNNWAGLFGRVALDGFFMTLITVATPLAKQGNVLHHDEDRPVSIRECARSQGFPDHYRFCGTIREKYCQIGNAVPLQMARAIGLELIRCIEF